MPDRGRSPSLSRLLLLLGLCAPLAGCQTLTPNGSLWEAIRNDGPLFTSDTLPWRVARQPTPPPAPTPATQKVSFWQKLRSDVRPVAPAPAAAAVIEPQAVVLWTAQSAVSLPNKMLKGKSVIGADGTMSLSTYGTVPVAGLTLEQARDAVTSQLARHLQDPQVTLTLGTPQSTLEGSPQPARVQGPSILRTSYMTASSLDAAHTPKEPPEGGMLHAPRKLAAGMPLPHPHGPGLPGGVPTETALTPLPPYVIQPPDILLVESTQGLKDQPIRGQHLVRPDGTIGLGIYGSAFVAGMTLEQAKASIGQVLAQRITDFDPANLSVDVLAYNSQFYYIITDGGGFGEQVYRVPVTGSDTVLDAIGQIQGLPPVASRNHIWVARRSADGSPDKILPVDWKAITRRGATATNYQMMPGDRLYVKAECLRTVDSTLAKVLSPIERLLGTTLLGASTVQTIRGNTGTGIP